MLKLTRRIQRQAPPLVVRSSGETQALEGADSVAWENGALGLRAPETARLYPELEAATVRPLVTFGLWMLAYGDLRNTAPFGPDASLGLSPVVTIFPARPVSNARVLPLK